MLSIYECDKTGRWTAGPFAVTRVKARMGYDPEARDGAGASVIGKDYGLDGVFLELDVEPLQGDWIDSWEFVQTDAKLEWVSGDPSLKGSALGFDGIYVTLGEHYVGTLIDFQMPPGYSLEYTLEDGTTGTSENPKTSYAWGRGAFQLHDEQVDPNKDRHIYLSMGYRSWEAPYPVNTVKLKWVFNGANNLDPYWGSGFIYSPTDIPEKGFDGCIQPYNGAWFKWGEETSYYKGNPPLYGSLGEKIEYLDTSLHPLAIATTEDGTRYRGVWLGKWYGAWEVMDE